VLALLFLLGLTLDLADPSAPGVVFFATDDVFVEGVVVRTDTAPATSHTTATGPPVTDSLPPARPAVRVPEVARPRPVAFRSRAALAGAPLVSSDARSEDH
jgi:hypothetical protein